MLVNSLVEGEEEREAEDDSVLVVVEVLDEELIDGVCEALPASLAELVLGIDVLVSDMIQLSNIHLAFSFYFLVFIQRKMWLFLFNFFPKKKQSI